MSLIFPLLISLFISISITIYSWRRRELPGASYFAIFMAFVTLLVLSHMVELISSEYAAKLFWETVEYSSTFWLPTMWALFAWQYTNHPKRPSRRSLIMLSIVPALFTLLVWNVQTQPLFWSSMPLDDNQLFVVPNYAVLSWVNLIYANLFLIIGVLFLVNLFFRSPRYYSKQVVALLIAVTIPWVATMLNVWRIFSFNPTALVISISGLIVYWGFFRAGLLEIVPIAQTSVIENLHEGIIVLDLQDRIVDINPAAQALIGHSKKKPIGRFLKTVFEPGHTLIQELDHMATQNGSLSISNKQLTCSLTLLSNSKGGVNGRLLTLRDITSSTQTAIQLQNYAQRLQILHNIDRAILNVQQAEKIGRVTLEHIRQLIPIAGSTIFVFNNETNEAHLLCIDQTGSDLSELAIKTPLNNYSGLKQLQKGEVYQLNHLQLATNLSPLEYRLKSLGIQQLCSFPLIIQDQLIGSLNLGLSTTELIAKEQLTILQEVSDALAVALQHAQLYEQERKQKELAQTFHQINQALTSSLNLQHVLELILDQLVQIIPYDSASIMLLEKGILRGVAHRSIHTGKRRIRHIQASEFEHLQTVIDTQVPLIIANTKDDQRWHTLRSAGQDRCWLGVPLIQNKQVIGLLNITKEVSNYYHQQASQTALIFASQAVTAIVNARLFESEQRARRQEEILRAAISATTKTLQLTVILPTLLKHLQDLVPFDSAGVMLLEDGNQLLQLLMYTITIHGHKKWIDAEQYKKTLYELKSMAGFQTIFETKKSLLIPDTNAYDSWVEYSDQYVIRNWLGVPLIARGEVIGFLSLSKRTPHFFSTEHTQAAKALAAQTAVSIQNARLYESEKQARKQEEILRAANIALTKSLDLDNTLSTLLDYVKRLISYDSASVMLIKDNKKVVVHSMRGYEQWASIEVIHALRSYQYDLDKTINLKTLFETKQGFIIDDTNEFDDWIILPTDYIIRNWLGVPLVAGGKVIGFFSIDKQEPHFFSATHLQAAEALAAQAAVAIQNAQLYQETQDRTLQLEALTDLSTILRAAERVQQMVSAILEKVISLVNGSYGGIYLTEKDSNHLILYGTFPSMPKLLGRQHQSDIGIIGHVAMHGDLHIVKNVATDPIIHIFEDEKSIMESMRCGINLPLRAQERIVGVLYIYMTQDHIFSSAEVQLLTAVSEIAGNAIHRALVLETLEQRVDKRTKDLAVANEQLLELDKLKSKFVADVSHELRTPVTNLQLYLDLFAHVSPEKQEKYLGILQTQSARLAFLIKDILTLSKLNAGTHKLQFSEVDFNEIIHLIVSAQTPRIEKENLEVKLMLEEPLPAIFASANQIKQVVSNLLANAINYASQEPILLKTSLSADKTHIYFWIKDSGPGILPEDIAHIFDRFYRGKSHAGRSDKPGTGLGLAIVKDIILAHKGKIDVKSNDAGTTFKIQIPVHEL